MSLATSDSVREAASLAEATLSGRVKDEQINAALPFAQERMQELITDYDDVVLLEVDNDKRIAYKRAESLLAASFLPKVLTSVQLAATGIVSFLQRGEEKRTVGDEKAEEKIQAFFEGEALRVLRRYRSADILDDAGKVIGVKSKKSKFSMMAI
jgi:hypothetical protein